MRMRTSVRCFLLLVVLLLSACAAPRTHRLARPTPVILISIDGFRPDYIDRGDTPTLAALAADGVRAKAMKPAFPTLTFPNHYTLVTGLYPDHHGIVNNRMVDPKTGAAFVYKDPKTIANPSWWGGEPIWVSVEKQGLHSATMFWPGSDVAIDGVRPSHWRRFDAHFTPDQRVDEVLRWIDLPGAERPVFYTLYFEQVDHAGHGHGPGSPEVDAALREVDAALARLVDGLERRGLFDRVNLVIVSDHGMTATARDHVIYLDDLLRGAGLGDDAADVVNYGILAGLDPRNDEDAALEHLLLVPHDHMRCWKKTGVPARLHYGTNPRIPALLCLADDGWVISSHGRMTKNRHFSLGEHGYDNDDPKMRALFVAHGPAFRHGLVVPEFDNLDVYPLLTRLLDIRPAPNDGDPAATADMLAPPSPGNH